MKDGGEGPRRWARKAGGIALTAGVVAALVWLNWRIATIVRSQELEDFPIGVEVKVDQQHEALITGAPGEIALVEQMDFEKDVLLFEDVWACFAGSRLEEKTIERLERRLGRAPPAEGRIVLQTGSFDRDTRLEERIEERCRARVEIASGDGESGPLRFRAFPSAACGMGGRGLGLRAEKGALRVRLSVVTPPGAPAAVACHRFLLVGEEWEGSLSAPFGMEIEVPPGGEVVLGFFGIGEGSGFAPVDFGDVRSLELVQRGNDEPVLHAQGLDGESAVRLDRFALLSNGLGVALTGRGPIAGEPGYLQDKGFQEWLLSQIKTNPFLSLFVGGLLVLLSRLSVTYLVEKPASRLWRRVSESRSAVEEPSATPEVTPGPEARGSRSSGPVRPPRGRRSSRSRRP